MLRLVWEDFRDADTAMMKNMLGSGLSMGFMSSLVNIGSLTLQTAINKLGQDIIVAHTAARKISEIFMTMFSVFGQTMATYCGQILARAGSTGSKKASGSAFSTPASGVRFPRWRATRSAAGWYIL